MVQFLAQAFFGSSIMNVTFGPMMMAFHRFTDMYIDSKCDNKEAKVTMWDTASGYGPSGLRPDARRCRGRRGGGRAGRRRARTCRPGRRGRSSASTRRASGSPSMRRSCPRHGQPRPSRPRPARFLAGTVAFTIEGTRHREGIWGTEPTSASRPVAFTVFVVCTPPTPSRGVGSGLCELLRFPARQPPPLRMRGVVMVRKLRVLALTLVFFGPRYRPARGDGAGTRPRPPRAHPAP